MKKNSIRWGIVYPSLVATGLATYAAAGWPWWIAVLAQLAVFELIEVIFDLYRARKEKQRDDRRLQRRQG